MTDWCRYRPSGCHNARHGSIAGSVEVSAGPYSVRGKEPLPTDSHRSGDGDAAELEQLRREASILREQLQSASGGQRSPREIQQLEARIDSLAARNAKLMDTLKEARQQLLALRGRSTGWASRPAVME